jgi:hypothetical protein
VKKVPEFILCHPKAKEVFYDKDDGDNNFCPVYNQRYLRGEVIGFKNKCGADQENENNYHQVKGLAHGCGQVFEIEIYSFFKLLNSTHKRESSFRLKVVELEKFLVHLFVSRASLKPL